MVTPRTPILGRVGWLLAALAVFAMLAPSSILAEDGASGVVPGTKSVSLSTAAVTATGGTTPISLANRFAQVVNAADYGVVADGTTDDTAAFAAAATAVKSARVSARNGESNGSGNIKFVLPAGNILITDSTAWNALNTSARTAGLVIEGQGDQVTQIRWAPSAGGTQYLWSNPDVGWQHVSIRDLTIAGVGNDSCGFLWTSTGGAQFLSLEHVHFFNIKYGVRLQGNNNNSEFNCKNCYIDGAANMAWFWSESNDQFLNYVFDNIVFQPNKGSELLFQKGGCFNVIGGSHIHVSSTVGTAMPCPVTVAAASSGATSVTLSTIASTFTTVNGNTFRIYGDSSVYTITSAATLTTGGVAVNISPSLQRNVLAGELGRVQYVVTIAATATAGDSTLTLKSSAGSPTLLRGDVVRVYLDPTPYFVQADTTLDTTGVAVPVEPNLTNSNAIGVAATAQPHTIFQMLGNTHSGGVTTATFTNPRVEHRNQYTRTMLCEWGTGTVTVNAAEEGSQLTTVGPFPTYVFAPGQLSGPAVVFQGGTVHGIMEWLYGSNAWQTNPSYTFIGTSFRQWTLPAQPFAFEDNQDVANPSRHGNLGAAPQIALMRCRGKGPESTGALDPSSWNTTINFAQRARAQSTVERIRLSSHQGGSPAASYNEGVTVAPGTITSASLYLAPGATANTTAGCRYWLELGDGTLLAEATPARLTDGFNVTVTGLNLAVSSATQTQILLRTNSTVPVSVSGDNNWKCAVTVEH